MQSKADLFHSYARKCDDRANATVDSALEALFLDLAGQWRELAATVESLSAEAGLRDELYGRGGALSQSSRFIKPTEP
jgi:hypothetical protein